LLPLAPVTAAAEDVESLKKAFEGVDAVFAMTLPNMKNYTPEGEYEQVKNLADAAKHAGAFMVFSTLTGVSEASGGKYVKVITFDQKYKGEKYIRQLGIPAAFVSPGSFTTNFHPRKLDPSGPLTVVAAGVSVDFVSFQVDISFLLWPSPFPLESAGL